MLTVACACTTSIKAQEVIEGALPPGYVPVRIEEARKYRADMKAYKKLIQDHAFISDMYESLKGQYNRLLASYDQFQLDSVKVAKERAEIEGILDVMRKRDRENRETIDQLRNSLQYCRSQVNNYRMKRGRKKMKIGLNGSKSSLDLKQ